MSNYGATPLRDLEFVFRTVHNAARQHKFPRQHNAASMFVSQIIVQILIRVDVASILVEVLVFPFV